MSSNPYQPPTARLLAIQEKRYRKTSQGFAAWATAIIFVFVSVALIYPLGGIEQVFATGRVPPLPRAVFDSLPYRHIWHLLTITAMAVAIALQSRRDVYKAFWWWTWALLAALWLVAYVLSVFAEFYINLYALSMFHIQVSLTMIFNAYLMTVGAVVLIISIWQRRSARTSAGI